MLVLTRKSGESILIGSSIRVRVVSVSGTHARIAIEAPDEVPILREEVYERIAEVNREAVLATSRKPRARERKREAPVASGATEG